MIVLYSYQLPMHCSKSQLARVASAYPQTGLVAPIPTRYAQFHHAQNARRQPPTPGKGTPDTYY